MIERAECLTELARLAGPDAMILLGADGNANRDELLRAYDDREGVTAEFDLNVLSHINTTHHCYKHAPATLETILRESGWHVAETFVDPDQRMRLWLADYARSHRAV
jgi:uncharacterized SAM-dependent methyltransferase